MTCCCIHKGRLECASKHTFVLRGGWLAMQGKLLGQGRCIIRSGLARSKDPGFAAGRGRCWCAGTLEQASGFSKLFSWKHLLHLPKELEVLPHSSTHLVCWACRPAF